MDNKKVNKSIRNISSHKDAISIVFIIGIIFLLCGKDVYISNSNNFVYSNEYEKILVQMIKKNTEVNNKEESINTNLNTNSQSTNENTIETTKIENNKYLYGPMTNNQKNIEINKLQNIKSIEIMELRELKRLQENAEPSTISGVIISNVGVDVTRFGVVNIYQASYEDIPKEKFILRTYDKVYKAGDRFALEVISNGSQQITSLDEENNKLYNVYDEHTNDIEKELKELKNRVEIKEINIDKLTKKINKLEKELMNKN